MPYLYSSFYEATQNGMPVNRSLAIDNTFDNSIYDHGFQNQFMFGQSIMVAPVESGKDFLKIYFPKGNWYNMYNDEMMEGGKSKTVELSNAKLPAFIKGSSIIPMQSLVQSTSIAPTDTLLLHVYKGNTANTLVYYEDDGKSFDYEKGMFYKRAICYDPASNQISLEKVDGQMASKFNNIALVLHGFTNMNTVQSNGTNVTVQQTTCSMLNAISAFDPQGGEGATDGSKTQTVYFKNNNNKIIVQL
jgi:alpha-glucosidase